MLEFFYSGRKTDLNGDTLHCFLVEKRPAGVDESPSSAEAALHSKEQEDQTEDIAATASAPSTLRNTQDADVSSAPEPQLPNFDKRVNAHRRKKAPQSLAARAGALPQNQSTIQAQQRHHPMEHQPIDRSGMSTDGVQTIRELLSEAFDDSLAQVAAGIRARIEGDGPTEIIPLRRPKPVYPHKKAIPMSPQGQLPPSQATFHPSDAAPLPVEAPPPQKRRRKTNQSMDTEAVIIDTPQNKTQGETNKGGGAFEEEDQMRVGAPRYGGRSGTAGGTGTGNHHQIDPDSALMRHTHTPSACMAEPPPALPMSVMLSCALYLCKADEDVERLSILATTNVGTADVPALNFGAASIALCLEAKNAAESSPGSNILLQRGVLPRSGLFRYTEGCVWGSAEVPSVDAAMLRRLQTLGLHSVSTLVPLLQGKSPFRLWAGRVAEGASASAGIGSSANCGEVAVVALETIPAGSWVMQWGGEYLTTEEYAQKRASPAGTSECCCMLSGTGGRGCAVPAVVARTPKQLAHCSLGCEERSDGKADFLWRRLPGMVLDSERLGNLIHFVPLSPTPCLAPMEIDLPTGPTGVFMFALREIRPGEVLTRMG